MILFSNDHNADLQTRLHSDGLVYEVGHHEGKKVGRHEWSLNEAVLNFSIADVHRSFHAGVWKDDVFCFTWKIQISIKWKSYQFSKALH